MKAQIFYDVCEITGCISGTELHDFFYEVCDGEPSPSGNVNIPLVKIADATHGIELLQATKSVTRKQRRELKEARGW